MRAFTLDHLSDDTLLAELAALVATDRQTTAAMLAHLAEVDERKLFLPAACASMHVYCTRVLHLAEEVAYKRIRAARIARRFPVIFDAIADGRLHVSGVVMLAPHLNDENVNDVLAAASHRSKAELEELVARLAPRPDLPERVERSRWIWIQLSRRWSRSQRDVHWIWIHLPGGSRRAHRTGTGCS